MNSWTCLLFDMNGRLGSIAATVAMVLSLAPGLATPQTDPAPTYPKRKAGLWEIKTTAASGSGLPPSYLCVGENTDNSQVQLDRQSSNAGACKFGSYQKVGNGYLAESVCKEGRNNITSRSLASGDFEKNYRVDTFVTYSPPLKSGKREDKEALVATYMGNCRAGQKVGDMFMPGMGYINMVDGSVKPADQGRRVRGK
jgi:hypothetical protein